MKPTLKELFESDNWIIVSIMQSSKTHRVDAKRRFPIADKSSFFSKWGSNMYLERLSMANYGKKLSEHSTYKY